jgi:phosphoenolpyruvate carboxykinase (GTP)
VRDKHVWVKWMERRVHGDVGAYRGPTGWLPKFADLKPLFMQVLKKDYTPEDYRRQFTIRVPENLAKLDRVERFHRAEVTDAPPVLFEILAAQRRRLQQAQKQFGDYIPPEKFPTEQPDDRP